MGDYDSETAKADRFVDQAVTAPSTETGEVGLREAQGLELTILMPCLNEAETIEVCVAQGARLPRARGRARRGC